MRPVTLPRNTNWDSSWQSRTKGSSNLDFIGDFGHQKLSQAQSYALFSTCCQIGRTDDGARAWAKSRGWATCDGNNGTEYSTSKRVTMAIAAIANNCFSGNERETRVDKLATGRLWKDVTIGVIAPPSADPSAATSLSYRVSAYARRSINFTTISNDSITFRNFIRRTWL